MAWTLPGSGSYGGVSWDSTKPLPSNLQGLDTGGEQLYYTTGGPSWGQSSGSGGSNMPSGWGGWNYDSGSQTKSGWVTGADLQNYLSGAGYNGTDGGFAGIGIGGSGQIGGGAGTGSSAWPSGGTIGSPTPYTYGTGTDLEAMTKYLSDIIYPQAQASNWALGAQQDAFNQQQDTMGNWTEKYNAQQEQLKELNNLINSGRSDLQGQFGDVQSSYDQMNNFAPYLQQLLNSVTSDRDAMRNYANNDLASMLNQVQGAYGRVEGALGPVEAALQQMQQAYGGLENARIPVTDAMGTVNDAYNDSNSAYQQMLLGLDEVLKAYGNIQSGTVPEETRRMLQERYDMGMAQTSQALNDAYNKQSTNLLDNLGARGILNSSTSASMNTGMANNLSKALQDASQTYGIEQINALLAEPYKQFEASQGLYGAYGDAMNAALGKLGGAGTVMDAALGQFGTASDIFNASEGVMGGAMNNLAANNTAFNAAQGVHNSGLANFGALGDILNASLGAHNAGLGQMNALGQVAQAANNKYSSANQGFQSLLDSVNSQYALGQSPLDNLQNLFAMQGSAANIPSNIYNQTTGTAMDLWSSLLGAETSRLTSAQGQSGGGGGSNNNAMWGAIGSVLGGLF